MASSVRSLFARIAGGAKRWGRDESGRQDLCGALPLLLAVASPASAEEIAFNSEWQFHRIDSNAEPTAPPTRADWSTITLPHTTRVEPRIIDQSLATRCVQAWTVGAALAQHLVVRGWQSSTDVVRFCWCSAAFKSDIARSKLFIGTARHACLCSPSCSMTVPRRREQPVTRSPGTPGNGVAEGGECLPTSPGR